LTPYFSVIYLRVMLRHLFQYQEVTCNWTQL